MVIPGKCLLLMAVHRMTLDPEDTLDMSYWQFKKPGGEWSGVITQYLGDSAICILIKHLQLLSCRYLV